MFQQLGYINLGVFLQTDLERCFLRYFCLNFYLGVFHWSIQKTLACITACFNSWYLNEKLDLLNWFLISFTLLIFYLLKISHCLFLRKLGISKANSHILVFLNFTQKLVFLWVERVFLFFFHSSFLETLLMRSFIHSCLSKNLLLKFWVRFKWRPDAFLKLWTLLMISAYTFI